MVIINKRKIGSSARIPRLVPPAQPGWYKRFKQLAARADKHFKTKTMR